MTLHEFRLQFQRLQKKYGKQNYDDDFGILLWESVQASSAAAFEETVNELITEEFRPVGATVIREMLQRKRFATHTHGSSIEFKSCVGCNGFGVVMMHHLNSGSICAFACDCANGRQQWAMAKGKTHGDSGKEFRFPFAGPALRYGWTPISDAVAERLLKARSYPVGEVSYEVEVNLSQCPWPEKVKAVPLMIEQKRTGPALDLICKMNAITHDEAWKIYGLFVEKRWHDPFILEIVKRKKSKSPIETLFEGAQR